MAQTLKSSGASWEIFETRDELDQAAVRIFFQIGRKAILKTGRCRVLLSGGRTPEGVYRRLGATLKPELSWEKVDLFLGDERPVPPDHPESNSRMVRSCLMDQFKEAVPQFYPVKGIENDPAGSALAYEKQMASVFQAGDRNLPRFDLVILGIGEDGHTASLFPGSIALNEVNRAVVAPYIEKIRSYRVTATLPLINRAREVIVLVKDKNKAQVLGALFAGKPDPAWPISRVMPVSGNLRFLLTREAASEIPLGK